MKPTVYIETSVISYLASKPSRDLIVAAHQQLTHEWWEQRRSVFDCFFSEIVLREAAAGDPEEARKRLVWLRGLDPIETTTTAKKLADEFLKRRILPTIAAEDGAHIAIAAVHHIDFLLTWNCTHLANAQIGDKVAAMCTELGFKCPNICTPEELMGD